MPPQPWGGCDGSRGVWLQKEVSSVHGRVGGKSRGQARLLVGGWLGRDWISRGNLLAGTATSSLGELQHGNLHSMLELCFHLLAENKLTSFAPHVPP